MAHASPNNVYVDAFAEAAEQAGFARVPDFDTNAKTVAAPT